MASRNVKTEDLPPFPIGWKIDKRTDEFGYTIVYSHPTVGSIREVFTPILPGVGLSYNYIDAIGVSIPSWKKGDGLVLYRCIEGRMELGREGSGISVLGKGGAVMGRASIDTFLFPMHHYVGTELNFAPQGMDSRMRDLLMGALDTLESMRRGWNRSNLHVLPSTPNLLKCLQTLAIGHPLSKSELKETQRAVGKLLKEIKAGKNAEEIKGVGYRHLTFAQRRIVDEVRDLILEDISVRHPSRELAQQFGVSPTALKSYFKAVFDETPTEFATRLRMERACALLAETDHPVVLISQLVGYENPGKFAAAFKREVGELPLAYREHHTVPEE